MLAHLNELTPPCVITAYPYDYSTNEYGTLQLNLTTCFIDFFAALGWAYNCRKANNTTSSQIVDKASLPSYSLAEVRAQSNQAAHMMVLDGYVYDITGFEELHPGGPKILCAYYGKDASKAFHGGVHKHTVAATNMLNQYIVGSLVEAEKSS